MAFDALRENHSRLNILALVGASKAIHEEFDLLGIVIVGLAMAFAGGATRDLLVTRVPLALQSPIEICLGLLGVGLAIATINAVGGGAFADILLDRAPFILFEDFYASCAVLGGSAYWIVGTLGATAGTAAAACAVVTVGTRLAAVTYGWNLPTAQKLGLQRE